MKSRLFSVFAAASLLVVGCVIEETFVETGTIKAVMENDQTRTSVTDEGTFTWSSGDQVWLHTSDGGVVGTLSSGAGTANATFQYNENVVNLTGQAVAPYNDGHSISGDELHVVLPASYKLGSNTTNTNAVMYGEDVDGVIRFNHLAGVMRFKFENVPAGTDKFQITLDKKINGTFTADLTEDCPIIEATSTSSESERTVTLNFDALTSVSDICLYVPLPVGTYESIDLEFFAGRNSMWKYSNTVTNKIGRKTLKLMPTKNLEGSAGIKPITKGPMTLTFVDVTAATVTFKSELDIDMMADYQEVGWIYSRDNNMDIESPAVTKVKINKELHTGTHTNLSFNTEYYYTIYTLRNNVYSYGPTQKFITDDVVVDVSASSITATTAQITCTIDGLSDSDESLIEVGIYYSLEESKVENGEGIKYSAAELLSENSVYFDIPGLAFSTTYYFCSYIKQENRYVYGDVKSFRTKNQIIIPPSDCQNLSATETANCYIISQSGQYCILVAKGNNSDDLLRSTYSATVLWESDGTTTSPNICDMIKSISYKDGYISFETSDTFKKGNAVIAAMDINGVILWSWHIWFTDSPQGQSYYNDAGVMMDRNLGATAAAAGQSYGYIGNLYQWGRKDPFLGYKEGAGEFAASTITWPSPVSSNSSTGTIEYATSNPTTFITYNSSNYDWYYTGSSSTDDTRWTTSESSKSIYDPCPAGWRVPDGGSNGVWSKALGTDSSYNDRFSGSGSFSNKLGDDSIRYPSGYYLTSSGYKSSEYKYGYFWSTTSAENKYAYCFCFYYLYSPYDSSNNIMPSCTSNRAFGYYVRCIQE